MPLTWTTEMGSIARTPELEDATRRAIIAACEAWPLPPKEQPKFSGTNFVVAVNPEAERLEASCTVGVTLVGRDRAELLIAAVRCAEIYAGAGGGEQGWKAVENVLTASRAQKAAAGAKRRR